MGEVLKEGREKHRIAGRGKRSKKALFSELPFVENRYLFICHLGPLLQKRQFFRYGLLKYHVFINFRSAENPIISIFGPVNCLLSHLNFKFLFKCTQNSKCTILHVKFEKFQGVTSPSRDMQYSAYDNAVLHGTSVTKVSTINRLRVWIPHIEMRSNQFIF